MSTTIEDTPPEMLRRLLPADRVPHVCVVGAGMTGLRCAEVLIKNGIKVDILEGRGRLGGRVGSFFLAVLTCLTHRNQGLVGSSMLIKARTDPPEPAWRSPGRSRPQLDPRDREQPDIGHRTRGQVFAAHVEGTPADLGRARHPARCGLFHRLVAARVGRRRRRVSSQRRERGLDRSRGEPLGLFPIQHRSTVRRRHGRGRRTEQGARGRSTRKT